jgi:predicted amidohydrolase YtcJ
MNDAAKSPVQVLVAKRILTMNPAQPHATHVAIRDGRILSVGNSDDVKQWGDAEIVDTFRDKVLMPGLVEGHCHLMEGAMWDAVYVGFHDRRGPDGVRRPGLQTLDAVIDRLKAAHDLMTDDQAPLLAWGFDPIFFGTKRLSVKELDTVCAGRPVVVLHASVHLMNVNSSMLALAGIDSETDIDGIGKDADGEPTGELQEFAAMFPVYRLIGGGLSIAASEKKEAIWNFGRVAQLAGVTTATDLVNDFSERGNQNLRDVTNDPAYPLRIVPAFAPQRCPEGGPQRVLSAIGDNTEKLRAGQIHRRWIDSGVHCPPQMARISERQTERTVVDSAKPVCRRIRAVP